MSFKPSKSKSLVLKKGNVVDKFRFKIAESTIPTLSEEPVKSLGKLFDCSLLMQYRDSRDPKVATVGIEVHTGRKWSAARELQAAEARLRQKALVGGKRAVKSRLLSRQPGGQS